MHVCTSLHSLGLNRRPMQRVVRGRLMCRRGRIIVGVEFRNLALKNHVIGPMLCVHFLNLMGILLLNIRCGS